jgi:hypothetical protein
MHCLYATSGIVQVRARRGCSGNTLVLLALREGRGVLLQVKRRNDVVQEDIAANKPGQHMPRTEINRAHRMKMLPSVFGPPGWVPEMQVTLPSGFTLGRMLSRGSTVNVALPIVTLIGGAVALQETK